MNQHGRSQQRNLFAEPETAEDPPHVVRPLQRDARVQCRAVACTALIRPELLMCARHWHAVPAPIRKRVWEHYRPGQGIGDALPGWWLAAAEAVEAVARMEGREPRNWFRQRYEELTNSK